MVKPGGQNHAQCPALNETPGNEAAMFSMTEAIELPYFSLQLSSNKE